MDFQGIILTQLNNLLHQIEQSSLEDKIIHFASDDSVCYQNWTIQKSNLLRQDLVNRFLESEAEGRSWIHANLIQADNQEFLITIRSGAKVGNPSPNVNVSFEPNHLIKFTD